MSERQPDVADHPDVWGHGYDDRIRCELQARADDWEAELGTSKVWHNIDDLLAMEPVDWLVEGLVPANGIGYLIGRDGTKKTFIALDMAMCLVTHRPFHGHRLGTYGRVLFIAGEGAHSFGARIGVWCVHNGVTLKAWQKDQLLVRSAAVNLFAGGEEFDDLLALTTEHQPCLIVVDTLQRSSAGAESNSAMDMGIVTARIDALKRATNGGTVQVLAHTGKGDQDTRGSSSIEDDADFVLHVKDRGGQVDIEVTKQKDGPSGGHIILRPVEVAGSLALADGAEVAEPLWSSTSNRARIIGALRTLESKGPCSQSEIADVCETDEVRQKINRGTISREIAKLIGEGAVEVHGKQYAISEGWTEPNPQQNDEVER